MNSIADIAGSVQNIHRKGRDGPRSDEQKGFRKRLETRGAEELRLEREGLRDQQGYRFFDALRLKFLSR